MLKKRKQNRKPSNPSSPIGIILLLFIFLQTALSSFSQFGHSREFQHSMASNLTYERFLMSVTLKKLKEDTELERVRNFILKGTEQMVNTKLIDYKMHLHNLLQESVKLQYGYKYSGDVDAGVILNEDYNFTPDLFDPESQGWADVTITASPDLAADAKRDKYRRLIDGDQSLVVFAFNIKYDEFLYFHYYQEGDLVKRDCNYAFLDDDSYLGLKNGLELFNSVLHYESLTEVEKNLHPVMEETALCEEAAEFALQDKGLLNRLISDNSFDSGAKERKDFAKYRNKEIAEMARAIAKEARGYESPMKPISTSGLKAAFDYAESLVKVNYRLLDSPKPSCHGMPGSIAKVPKVEDTRRYVVDRFSERMKFSKFKIFQEIHNAIQKNYDEVLPEYAKSIKRLKKLLGQLHPILDEHKVVKKKLREFEMRQTWDRESLRLPHTGEAEKLMHCREKDKKNLSEKMKKDPRVGTIEYWNDDLSELIRKEIYHKSNSFIKNESCWTPHKEYKPKLKERGRYYKMFLKSRMYQEIAQVGQLAGNILRLVTKPRRFSSVTTASNANMMAIVGPGESAMNEMNTVPILWVSLNSEESQIWMPTAFRDGELSISNGDRLTKARLEQMVDAARIASVAASIVCCEMIGSQADTLYACGVMACVAMSINIRDSELIDHIRYMVPNIFSERSCAEDYVREKYNCPLKTSLQALIYQETKKTLLLSAEIAKKHHEVEIENDEVVSGGVNMEIPFLNCIASSVFKLNGVVYTAFFSCKKGLHDPRAENKKMFDKICEFEHKSFKRNLVEASFDENSYHYFDPKYVALTMSDMVDQYGNTETWRSKVHQMDNLKKPFQLPTFSSLRSSMQTVCKLDKIRSRGVKSKVNSKKQMKRIEEITEAFEEIWSDERTRVVDHFFDMNHSILQEAIRLMKLNAKPFFYATWDQKRQRTGRDREVFILDPNGKVFMHNIESLFKVVCEGVPHELITLPGNKKIIAMGIKGTQYFKKQKALQTEGVKFEALRMTEDMTKWAPGDNACKFIYAIAGLPFLTKMEKVWYINFLCTTLRKRIVLNAVATEGVGALCADGHVKENEMWAQMLGVNASKGGKCTRFESNSVEIRFNWLMGVLNDASSAVHAACAGMLKKVLERDYLVHHYEPDVHSDDAALDLIVTKKPFAPIGSKKLCLDYITSATIVNLKRACIKLSEKKSYIDKYRKEFVSEVDDNGIIKSYWQKQAVAAISGMSYIDFFRDISEGCSKVSNLVALGGPPTVYEVTMSNVVDLARETYSMQPGMWNDPDRFLSKTKRKDLPLELGGAFDMKPILLPIVGMKFQTFSRMVDQVLEVAGVRAIHEVDESHHEKLQMTQGNLFCKVWMHTSEAAVKEGLVMDRVDPGMIRFKQFAAIEKTKELRLMKDLEKYEREFIDNEIELDPTIVFRQAETIEEQQLKLAIQIKNPAWYSSATLQSQGALKMDRMFNVRTPCCTPVRNDSDVEPMETGMKTIREAIIEGIRILENRNMNLLDTYKMIRSMPLLCYVYDLDQISDYTKRGPRVLFPVQKEAFLKGNIIESSAVGLLQQVYTGDTSYFLNRANLEKEVEIVKLYQDSLSHLEPSQQAVTIFRLFQQTRDFSSVYFVPSPRLKGYEAISGLLGNQFSDVHSYQPNDKFKPPENKIYEMLTVKNELSVEQKASELACFLVRTCTDIPTAKIAFESAKIEGRTTIDIVNNSTNKRASAYAQVLLCGFNNLEDPEENELIWIVSQQRSYPHWTGDFMVFMNVGTKERAKGVFLSGHDQMIDEIFLMGPPNEYPHLKSKILNFCTKLHWRGSVQSHLNLVPPENKNSLMLVFNQYGSGFQTQIRTGLKKGIPVFIIGGGIDLPRLKYDELTNSGVIASIHYRGEVTSVRTLNQRLTEKFKVDSTMKLGIYTINQIWDNCWTGVRNNFTTSIDTMPFKSKTFELYLSSAKTNKLTDIGIECRALTDKNISQARLLNENPFDKSLNLKIFSGGTKWTQNQFNIYMSMSLQYKSKTCSWISLKGHLQKRSDEFIFLPTKTIQDTITNPFEKHCYRRDFMVTVIYKNASVIPVQEQTEIPATIDDWKYEGVWRPRPAGVMWTDLGSDSSSDDEKAIY